MYRQFYCYAKQMNMIRGHVKTIGADEPGGETGLIDKLFDLKNNSYVLQKRYQA